MGGIVIIRVVLYTRFLFDFLMICTKKGLLRIMMTGGVGGGGGGGGGGGWGGGGGNSYPIKKKETLTCQLWGNSFTGSVNLIEVTFRL